MKICIFTLLLCIFAVCDSESRRKKPKTTSTTSVTTTKKPKTTSTTSVTTTQPSTQSPSCIDISTVMCEVAYKISNNRKKFCYERGEDCCVTCKGAFTTTSAATTTIYMTEPTTEPSDQSPSCTDISSELCKIGYYKAKDRMSFCTETGNLCCETCKETSAHIRVFYSSQF